MDKYLGGIFGSLFLLALLVACNTSSPGTKVTVHPLNYTGQPQEPIAVAYQIEDGAWQRLLPDQDGAYSFYVPSGKKRYGVAVNCGGFFGLANLGSGAVLQLSTDEATEPAAGCLTMGPFVEVDGSFDTTGVTGVTRTVVYGDYGGHSSGSTTGSYQVELAYGSARDLLVLATDSSYNVLAGKIYRNLDATQPFGLDVNLTDADAPTESHSVSAFAVPSGWNGHFGVNLLTAGGAMTNDNELGDGDETGGSYAVLPNLSADELYLVIAYASDSGGREVSQLHQLSGTALTDVAPSLMDPWPGGYSVAPSDLPTFALDHPDASVQLYQVFTITPYQFWTHTVSKGWLAGASSYTLPDLTSVRGFEGSKGLSGEDMSWYVLAAKSNLSVGEYVGVPQAMSQFLSFPRHAGAVINTASLRGDFTIP